MCWFPGTSIRLCVAQLGIRRYSEFCRCLSLLVDGTKARMHMACGLHPQNIRQIASLAIVSLAFGGHGRVGKMPFAGMLSLYQCRSRSIRRPVSGYRPRPSTPAPIQILVKPLLTTLACNLDP